MFCLLLYIAGFCVLYRKSLDLIDVLLQLADEGFQALVLELFKFPMQYCPDLLLLGLLQIVRILFYMIVACLLNCIEIVTKY